MATLPEYTVLDWKLERLPPPALRELQTARLRTMVRYVYDAAPFWREKLDAAGLTPADVKSLDDVARIPFCTKEELQDDQRAHPPFGSYVASHSTEWIKYMATSGTTGAPLRRVFSKRDWQYVLDRFQRNPIVGPGDVVMILGPVDGLMGPTAAAEGMARTGALVVPAGLYDTKAKLRLMADLRPTMLSGTASYLLHLLEVAPALGLDPRRFGIRLVSTVGEPGGAVPATRQRLAEGWAAAVNDGYGMTELFPLGGGCPHSTALHIPGDLVITEIVDPETGQPRPLGEAGEIVYTNLVGDTQPLLRYRTRDVARQAPEAACGCGFTGPRLANSIEGRVDDMIWFRGANVFPSAIEAVVRGFPELGPEYQIEVSGERALPTLRVRVELAAIGASAGDMQQKIRAALRASLGLGAEVEVVAAGTLPRPDARSKAQRVIDRRGTP